MNNQLADRAGPGAEIGPCRLIRELGAGGMGRVFLSELTEDRSYASAGSRVALKLLRPELLERAETVRRFEREAEAGSRIVHSTVVRTFEAGQADIGDGTAHFLVLEFVEGRTLRELMTELKVLPEPLLRDLGIQVARGLQAVHEAEITHRDIKPENILITPDHRVKLMDLGVAHLATESTRLTRAGSFIGTLMYAAPEQLSGSDPGPAADLYSLGVILYEASTGTEPFAAKNTAAVLWRALEHVPPPPGDTNPELTPFFESVITRLLEKRPDNRFESAAELAVLLDQGEESAWWQLRTSTQPGDVGRPPALAAAGASEVPFVGRDMEIEALEEALEEAIAGRGRVVWLEGEPGVGKSRLLEEFYQRTESRYGDLNFLYGTYPPGGYDTGPGALGQAILDRFGEAALEARLGPYLEDLSEVVPAFAAHLKGMPPPTGAPLSSESLHALYRGVARGLARRRPTIWIVEDVHYATADSLRIIASLVGQLSDQPILVIVTGRPDEAAELASAAMASAGATRLRLDRLEEADVIDILEKKLGRRSVASRLGGQLAARTGGNPFFLFETIRDLEEKGILERLVSDPALTLSDLDRLETPASVKEVVESRLRMLPDEERRILDVAAVQAFDFDPDLICRVLETPRLKVLQTLAALERRQGLVKPAGRHFRFDHPQLHDVLYEAIPELLREEYHALSASSYQAQLGLTASDGEGARYSPQDAVLLANHFFRGDRPGEGKPFAVIALRHLKSRYRNEALVQLASVIAGHLGPDEAALLSDVQVLRADALAFLARSEESAETARQALEMARLSGDNSRIAQAGLRIGRSALRGGDLQGAQVALTDALSSAQDAGDQLTSVEILTDLGRIVGVMGRFDDARRHLEQQLSLAREIGAGRLECEGLSLLTNLSLGLDEYATAEQLSGEHLEVARREGFQESETTALFNLGQVARWTGDIPQAVERFSEQLRLSGEIAYSMGEALAHLGLLQSAFEAGRLDDAEHHGALGSDLCELSQLRPMLGFFMLYGGDVAWGQGQRAEADTLYRGALEQFREQGAGQGVAHAAFALGRLCLEQGDRESARRLFGEAAELVRRLDVSVPGSLPAAYLGLMGDSPLPEVDEGYEAHAPILAELNLVLYQSGAGEEHRERARAVLESMSARLPDAEQDAFWQGFPVARMLLDLEEVGL